VRCPGLPLICMDLCVYEASGSRPYGQGTVCRHAVLTNVIGHHQYVHGLSKVYK
jgi:hypothetical protein